MANKHIITGQHPSPNLKARAQELRRQMTPSETKLWDRLRANRLEGFHFRRQQIIDGYIVDFYCHSVGLVVEVDGDIHLKQEDYDQYRDAHLRELGLTVLRFPTSEVEHNLDSVLFSILETCRAENSSKT
jgi:very-short-patch-repair endonuclease